MRDLETATERLKESSDSLIVVKDGHVLLSKDEGGIRPLFNALSELGEDMKGSCIADKVIGKAAAALCVFAGAAGVYTPVMSKAAVRLLADNGIVYSMDLLVPGVLNKDKADLCPLEKMTANTDDYRKIYEMVKGFVGKPFK
ncbi:MAG: DUF1893 domain-containing protein [Bacillota bacterium]|nr:DUF1893 domain-containing protein [Bacillota bacterium]MDD3297933.1 DUF1893 domain-containing protein [Bacillota bacterium]MDD3850591.1 DUF1893 domain-containing protein [Bacillota bacterium]MDD4707379.1 DUF1893 domain-containing protein [Bacillota bacterium]